MAPKKVSNLERIIEFFHTADPTELKVAFDVVSAIVRVRTPKPAATTKARGGRRKKETQPPLPETGSNV